VIALPTLKKVSLNGISEYAQQISLQKTLPFDLSELLQPGLVRLIDLQGRKILLDSEL
jgi:hypothetical protein